ncbi:MAG: type VI secretion system tip protein VgrG [Labilithrix sp.]|nr:type VI secretion system tip protein VgrG [Labilithrix sp.]MCW5811483.1 type VI secretion system tip protein VgrG [Labilithrix sp.]
MATLSCPDLAGGVLRVESATLIEEISTPTRAVVVVAPTDDSTLDPADPEALIGSAATLSIVIDQSTSRSFPLVVTAVDYLGLDHSTHDLVSLQLEHPLALLRLQRDRRPFLEKSVEDIAKVVTQTVDVTADWKATRGKTPRIATVQYDETDYDFFSRLLEEEGIFWFSPDDTSAPKLVVADAADAFSPVAGETVPFADEDVGRGIDELLVEHHVTSGAVALRDYDFEKPGVDLLSRTRVDEDAAGELFEYPGRFTTQSEGGAIAKIRAEEVASSKMILRGSSDRPHLRAAAWFTLTTARDRSLPTESGKYLLRRVEHTYDKGHYRNAFVASPFELPFRPARTAPRPVAAGTSSAVATGPSGQEIHTDKLGRTKLKYGFDRLGPDDDASSQWVRVLQPALAGSMMLARVGWELAVRHLDGDPDRPVVVARMYDGQHLAPEKLPDLQTKTSFDTFTSPRAEKINAITIDDKGGAMKMEVIAAKDLDATILHDESETIGANDTVTIGKDSTTLIGGNQTSTVEKDDTAKALKDAGVAVAGNRKKTVTKDETTTIEGGVSARIDGNDEESVGQDLTVAADAELLETAKGKYDLTVLASVTASAKKDYTIYVAGKSSETVGAAKTVASSDGPLSEAIGGDATFTVGGAWVETVDGNRVSSAKGEMARTVGAAATLTAAGKLQLAGKTVKVTVAGAGTFIGAGGIVSLTAASVGLVGVITLKGSGGVEIVGNPQIAM